MIASDLGRMAVFVRCRSRAPRRWSSLWPRSRASATRSSGRPCSRGFRTSCRPSGCRARTRCSSSSSGRRPRSDRSSAARSSPPRGPTSRTGSTPSRSASRRCSCSGSRPGCSRATQPIGRGHWGQLAEGFGSSRHSRALLCVLIAWSIVMVATGIVNVAEVFLAKESYDSGDFGFGLLWTGSGIGLVLGGLAAAALIRRDLATAYVQLLAIFAIGIIAAAVAPNVWLGRRRDGARRRSGTAARSSRTSPLVQRGARGSRPRPRLHAADERQLRGARRRLRRRGADHERGRRALGVRDRRGASRS